MGTASWIVGNWFDLIQTVAIVAGLLFTAHTVRTEDRSRRISNHLALNSHYRDIWQEFYNRPDLKRVLNPDADVAKTPVSDAEWLFVKFLILHMDAVHRAKKAEMLVKIEGMELDVGTFMRLPVPSSVWSKLKSLQNKDFVEFIEAAQNTMPNTP